MNRQVKKEHSHPCICFLWFCWFGFEWKHHSRTGVALQSGTARDKSWNWSLSLGTVSDYVYIHDSLRNYVGYCWYQIRFCSDQTFLEMTGVICCYLAALEGGFICFLRIENPPTHFKNNTLINSLWRSLCLHSTYWSKHELLITALSVYDVFLESCDRKRSYTDIHRWVNARKT